MMQRLANNECSFEHITRHAVAVATMETRVSPVVFSSPVFPIDIFLG
jgi:hypothetical protein